MKLKAQLNPLNRAITKALIAIGTIGLVLIASDFPSGSREIHVLAQTIQNTAIDSTHFEGKHNNPTAAGNFKVHLKRRSFLSASAIQNVVLREQQVERVAALMNRTVTLPEDLYLSLAHCGDEDAFYDEDSREVTVCNELLDRLHRDFSVETKSRTGLRRMVLGTMNAILFHEVAHALIDLWKLPVTGREEDAADQFSAVMLLAQKSEGEQMLLDTANAFKLEARWSRANREATTYWDGHSTDGQRFYNSLCLLYGENPEKFGFLVWNRTLPFERAELCSAEFQRTRRAWALLLAPYLKQGVTLLPDGADNEGLARRESFRDRFPQ